MSLRKTRVVDWLGIEKGTGAVLLTAIDDEDWREEDEHVRLFQDKLNAYLAFIESGEVFERLADDVGQVVSPNTAIKTPYPRETFVAAGRRRLSEVRGRHD